MLLNKTYVVLVRSNGQSRQDILAPRKPSVVVKVTRKTACVHSVCQIMVACCSTFFSSLFQFRNVAPPCFCLPGVPSKSNRVLYLESTIWRESTRAELTTRRPYTKTRSTSSTKSMVGSNNQERILFCWGLHMMGKGSSRLSNGRWLCTRTDFCPGYKDAEW